MGQVGFITFFVTHKLPDPASTLVRLLKLTEAPTAWYVSRDDNPTSEWDELQRFINDGQEYPESESYFAARNSPIESAAIHMRDGALIRCGFAGTPLGTRLESALAQALPVELHQGFLPADPVVAVGPHDIFECAEHDEGLL